MKNVWSDEDNASLLARYDEAKAQNLDMKVFYSEMTSEYAGRSAKAIQEHCRIMVAKREGRSTRSPKDTTKTPETPRERIRALKEALNHYKARCEELEAQLADVWSELEDVN